MRKIEKQNMRAGFTLVELMIVVAIIGILAAIAIPAFTHYIDESKDAEAVEKLKAISDSAVLYYHTPHLLANDPFRKAQYVYPTSGWKYVPQGKMTIGERKSITADDLKQDGWKDLRFDSSGSHVYQYGYSSSDPVSLEGGTGNIGSRKFMATAAMPLSPTNSRTWSVVGCPNGSVVSAAMVELAPDAVKTHAESRLTVCNNAAAPAAGGGADADAGGAAAAGGGGH